MAFENLDITVRKLDENGRETWRYRGRVLERTSNHIRLEAYFDRDEVPLYEVVLRRGDRFVESFFADRWYNIFEIHDRADDRIKCWYCNVGYPADLDDHTVAYRDLALDLLVYPDKRMLVLDEDEFDALEIDEATRVHALTALRELQRMFG